ncbi:putative DNA-binding transcriptional regulator AlpA [Dysgonomonas hofstadii]|uniref:Putative DNA-binding transcriptional regulator AlpA n=1 Tax=Dysgonomonas hofstadii TaxID=637886 RepID=A0A840CPU8_9BACT|nr:helix-turn-helix domain-containing protein [Dysgonomonas hofstadii]MBB4037081.1 putative DNA-binding transcriptional regulator AlpA [Dysgonomonas hofstadii]
MKGYLNLQQTCNALGVKRTTLYKIIHEGAFVGKDETIVHRNKRWFLEKAIDNYIQSVIKSNTIELHTTKHKH